MGPLSTARPLDDAGLLGRGEHGGALLERVHQHGHGVVLEVVGGPDLVQVLGEFFRGLLQIKTLELGRGRLLRRGWLCLF